jgi:hypothetical protein
MAERRLRSLAADGTLATLVTGDLELGYSARDPREHQGIFPAAGQYGASVLHYDADFDHIAAVIGQPVDWIAPPGSAA